MSAGPCIADAARAFAPSVIAIRAIRTRMIAASGRFPMSGPAGLFGVAPMPMLGVTDAVAWSSPQVRLSMSASTESFVLPACFIIGLMILAVSGAILDARAARARRTAMRAYAQANGLSFTEEDASFPDRMEVFPQFSRGHSRRALNIMSGTVVHGGVRMEMLAGDFRYRETSGHGKRSSTTTYNLSFISVRPMLVIGEELSVREEGLSDKISAFFGADDIDFESSEFSKRFHVQCSDRRFAFDLFDPRMMEYFLQTQPPEIEARGGVLLFTRDRRNWELPEIEATRSWIDGFFSRVPRHVRAARLPQSEHAADPVLNPTDGGTTS